MNPLSEEIKKVTLLLPELSILIQTFAPLCRCGKVGCRCWQNCCCCEYLTRRKALLTCRNCKRGTCVTCANYCYHCKEFVCNECKKICQQCEDVLCCFVTFCRKCFATICGDCIINCELCKNIFCEKCCWECSCNDHFCCSCTECHNRLLENQARSNNMSNKRQRTV